MALVANIVRGMKRWFSDYPLMVSMMAAVLIAATVFLASYWGIGIWGSNQSDHGLEVTLSSRSGQKRGMLFSEAGRSSDQLIEESKAARSSENSRLNPERKRFLASKAQVDSAGKSQLEKALAGAAAAERERVSGLRRKLLLEAAERALDSPTTWSDLALVALGFKRAGDDKAARYWFERASRLALDPDDCRSASRAMREVVKSMLAARYFDMAAELISRIPEARERAMARAELVKTYARNRDFDRARALAMTLNDVGAQGLAFRSVAEAEARYVSLDVALITLQMISRASDRDRAFSSVSTVRAGMGDADGAMSLVRRISNSRLRDSTLAKIATIQERGGRVSIDALVGLIHDPTFRDQVLREAIVREASQLGVDLAAKSVRRIESEAERAQAYESLVMLQIRRGELDRALARAQAIDLAETRFRALQAVAVAEVRSDGTASARNIANLIGDGEMREVTFGKIARQAAIFGQHRGAVDTIRFINDPTERSLAFANVALTQARYGQDRQALMLVQDANRELLRIEGDRARARTQGVMAEVFAETGDAHAAISTASLISNVSLRDVTYQRLALSFARLSEPSLATQSAQLIERETTRERALASVATTLASRVPLTQAVRVASSLNGYRQQVRFLLGVAGRKS